MPIKDKQKRREAHARYLAKPGVREKRKAAYAQWAVKNRERLLEKEADRRLLKRAQCLVATARTRARKRGIAFDLDGCVSDIQRRIDAGVCELTGFAFDLSPGRKHNSPSIDRIRPELGYVSGNIRVVCLAINAAMGDWGEGPLRQIVACWLGHAIVPQAAAAFVSAYMASRAAAFDVAAAA